MQWFVEATYSAAECSGNTEGTLTKTAHQSSAQNAPQAQAERDAGIQAFNDGLQVVQDGGWPVWWTK